MEQIRTLTRCRRSAVRGGQTRALAGAVSDRAEASVRVFVILSFRRTVRAFLLVRLTLV